MLPYAPVQMLLFTYDDDVKMTDCLVMTSGNVSGAPICRSDEDARSTEISGFCDVILSHNRKIRLRADDSVMDFFEGKPYMIRRSRGYAPLPFMLSG
jgi:hydrogenase maturation protein HypF